ncbi:DUF6359 domain-containing protein [Paludifilum halophilum]|uniref:DUF6359 domain-containing protein n=1 Tax=Paludifilum halophilum TaxID=1642702 RepID=UPI00113FF2CB|nr:DUF6359 domain-containing protein [Paludifilum halophilum]
MSNPVWKRLSVMLFLWAVMTVAALPAAGAAEGEKVVSVEEAIADNSGQATVEGYIVGTSSSTSALGEGRFESPFSVRTNLLLADDPKEREMDRLLPVQLPNHDVRKHLNLDDHPEHLGKKVRVSGELSPYFAVPGLRSASSYEWAESDPEEVV